MIGSRAHRLSMKVRSVASQAGRIFALTALLCSWPFGANASDDGALDILIENARVLDGSGNPWFWSDIGIRADRIALVGKASPNQRSKARTLINARGLVAAPGFIDMHSHLSVDSPDARAGLSFLYQGITSAITGNDGGGKSSSIASTPDGKLGFALNIGFLVGASWARNGVLGMDNRAPTEAELERMKQQVRAGMENGAFGISSDLFGAPGSYSTTAEIAALAAVAAEYGGYYDTHIRDEGVAVPSYGFLNALKEAIAIGEKARMRVNISHIHPLGSEAHGLADEAIQLVEAARSRGLEITADQYPYTASMNSLAAAVIPRWAQAGGLAALRERLGQPSTAGALADEIREMIRKRGGAQSLVFVKSEDGLPIAGKSIADLATEWKVAPSEVVKRVVMSAPQPIVVSHNQDARDVQLLARQEWVMTCSDAFSPIPGEGAPHPRAYGAFPRKIRMFVREDGAISLPFAIRSMTSLPAATLRIRDRGAIREQLFADIVLFDDSQFTDRATFEQPHQHALGITHVLVNGKFAIKDGKPTGVLSGVALKRH